VREVDWSETESHKPVGRKEPNAWGLHDMHGNVWEWTETAGGEARVNRGGSWNGSAVLCESSCRRWFSPGGRLSRLGFRLCASGRADTEETHAENAESAESGSPAGGAGERSETEGVSHAESAENAEP